MADALDIEGFPLPGPATRFREGRVVWFRRNSDGEEFGVRIYSDDGRSYTAEFKRLMNMAATGQAKIIEHPTRQPAKAEPPTTFQNAAPQNRSTRATRSMATQ